MYVLPFSLHLFSYKSSNRNVTIRGAFSFCIGEYWTHIPEFFSYVSFVVYIWGCPKTRNAGNPETRNPGTTETRKTSPGILKPGITFLRRQKLEQF